MSREIKVEHFFYTREEAVLYYNEQKRSSAMYNIIRFTYLGAHGSLCYYLVTTRTLMTVICEAYDYLGMLARYSINKLGYEPGDCDCFLKAIELIEF